MSNLSIAGLVLDLAGVLMLGADLVRVQRRLSREAKDRLTALDQILEEIGGIEGWAKTIPNDFRDWQWDEGRTIHLDGTFDSQQARESFKDAIDTIEGIGAQVLTLAKMQVAAIESDTDTADKSLFFSYFGLTFIALGFALQVAAYF